MCDRGLWTLVVENLVPIPVSGTQYVLVVTEKHSCYVQSCYQGDDQEPKESQPESLGVASHGGQAAKPDARGT